MCQRQVTGREESMEVRDRIVRAKCLRKFTQGLKERIEVYPTEGVAGWLLHQERGDEAG
jgi:hypothetical protein